MKILSIGNSFSQDAQRWLHNIATVDNFELDTYNLFIGGCSLETHWQNIENNAVAYSFEGNNGRFIKTVSIEDALNEYDYDIITMQQVSSTSGVPSSLGNLQNLIDYVNAHKTNPNAKFYWHMTWAYSQFSTHGSFPTYNKDQMTMYNAIIDVTKNNIATNTSFAGIIPAGTAVQNYRDNQINDSTIESKFITTDGYHLQTYSQLLVTLTWLRTLTGLSLDDVTCTSHTNVKFVKDYQLAYLKKAAEAAYLNPYEVTYVYSG